MLPKLVGAVAIGLGFASLAVPATAGQVQKVPTTVEIWGADFSDEPTTLLRGKGDGRVYGRVFADKPKCAKLRKLSIFDQRDGADFRLGTGYSDSLGYWSINTPIADITGPIYAIAPKAKRGKRTLCKADRSPAIWVAFRTASGGRKRVPSVVEIDNYHAEGDEVVFSGVVSSPKHACEKRRKVLVIGRDEQAGNAKRVLGRDRTGPQGRFDVREQIPFFEDYAWAKLKRARLDNGTKCKGARSEEISTAG